jgi:hypothetical protein
MTRWEFTYFALWLGEDIGRETVQEAQEKISKLGSDGWEPVGQVDFRYHKGDSNAPNTTIKQLMFKRPIED